MGEAGSDADAFVAAARAGDAAGFAEITERYRRDLLLHCYRMLANVEDAQDVVQEAFLRAWRGRASFQGRASVRTWLHRIATNACLDFLGKRGERAVVPTGVEVAHLQPFPDRMLPEDPQDAVVARETVELAFVVALQHLPARQRAVFVLRDVLGWPAATAAEALGVGVASVTSALQRARVTVRARLPGRRLDWAGTATRALSEDERGVLKSYMDAHERGDLAALAALLRADLRFAMLPDPGAVVVGARDAVDGWVAGGLFQPGEGTWRCAATTVNLMPAAVLYLRLPDERVHRVRNLAVLHVVDGAIAELTGFDVSAAPWLGVAPTL